MVMRVVFVCTGNTCRSPLAEALGRDMAGRRGLTDLAFESAGTAAWDGAPASDGALLVGLERNLDLNAHRARQLSRDVVDRADLVLAMGAHHLERIEALGGAGKAHLLTAYASRGQDTRTITDPFGGDLEAYRNSADEIARLLDAVLIRLAEGRPSGNP
jgi:protein-tyrosine-phosphatase